MYQLLKTLRCGRLVFIPPTFLKTLTNLPHLTVYEKICNFTEIN